MSAFFQSEKPYHCLGYCTDLLGGPKLNFELADVFFRAVGCDDADAVARALAHWLRTQRRFPAPADIREALGLAQPATEEGRAHA